MDFYREEILEHWRNPQNWGEMRNADVVIDQINPLCGDQLTFYFKIARLAHLRGEVKTTPREHLGGVIQVVSFTGKGCAISIASASMLTEYILGKPTKSLSKIVGKDILELIGGPVAPARLKCAFLGLEAIKRVANPVHTSEV